MPLSAMVSGGGGEVLVLLSKSQEQRWRHEAGWSFPIFRLGTSTGSEHSGCAMPVCAELLLGTKRSISHIKELPRDHYGLTVFMEGPRPERGQSQEASWKRWHVGGKAEWMLERSKKHP